MAEKDRVMAVQAVTYLFLASSSVSWAVNANVEKRHSNAQELRRGLSTLVEKAANAALAALDSGMMMMILM